MIKPFLRGLRPFSRLSLYLLGFAALTLGACIFSPDPVPKSPYPTAETTPYDTLTDVAATVVVELFEPYFNSRLAPGEESSLLQGYPVRVKEHGTGRVIEYRPSQRGYGTWNAELERKLHLFLLRGFFLKAGIFEDTTGLGHIDSLYARAALHDTHTRRIDSADAEEYKRLSRTTVRPRVFGFQIRFNDTEDTLFIDLVAPGSPAHQAGLRRNMAILAVNDSDVTGDSAYTRFVRFVQADTVSTKFTVLGPQGTLTQNIGRDSVNFPTVVTDSIGGAGYISIYSFTQSTINGGSTASEFAKALQATRHFPATVLDLRGNGGGSLGVVLQMCDAVLSSGVIIRLIERNLEGGASVRTESAYRATAGSKDEGRSFVLLADGGSASASEIFIAALRDNLNTPFVGSHTYGKGVGQASFDTPGGEIAIMTYGTALTANRLDYNGTGLQPTIPSTAKPDAMLLQAANVAVPGALAKRAAEGFARSDAQRAGVITWNRGQALRPDVLEWGEKNYELRITNSK
jgi:carboxyl-terminal processing protease